MDTDERYEEAGSDDDFDAARAVWRAESARSAGDPASAVRIARRALSEHDDPSLRVALALALLDLGDTEDAREELELLLDLLGGDALHSLHAGAGTLMVGSAMIPDRTLAAATADTLELVNLDEASFERAFEQAEAERDLMLDADRVAEQVLDTVPVEVPDELLPSVDSPFATRTFADLLERQGHAPEAESLRSALGQRRPDAVAVSATSPADSPPDFDDLQIVATLERWLENLTRRAA